MLAIGRFPTRTCQGLARREFLRFGAAGRDLMPAWSPDGRRIEFTSVRDGNEEFDLIDADGSGPRNLSHHLGRDNDPAWHPDGRRIAFVSDRSGQSEIYRLDPETKP